MSVSPITDPQLGWQWRRWVGGMLTKLESSIRDTSLRLAFQRRLQVQHDSSMSVIHTDPVQNFDRASWWLPEKQAQTRVLLPSFS